MSARAREISARSRSPGWATLSGMDEQVQKRPSKPVVWLLVALLVAVIAVGLAIVNSLNASRIAGEEAACDLFPTGSLEAFQCSVDIDR